MSWESQIERSGRTELVLFVVVAAVTMICFAPALRNGLLIWDDSGYIVENHNIRNFDLQMFGWAFRTFYANYWAPLTWISLALDHAVWGLNPTGYHLTNNILHSLNTGMVFLLLSRICRWLASSNGSVPGCSLLGHESRPYLALFVSLFFGLHPLRVQSVAWATERKDVLCVFFGLVALLKYLDHVRIMTSRDENRNSPFCSPAYWWTFAMYVLSLMSKSMLVMFPLLLLLLDWFPYGRWRVHGARLLIVEKLPLMIPALAASILTIMSQGESVAGLAQADLTTRLILAARSLISYLRLTVWPIDISPFYVNPGRSITTMSPQEIVTVAVAAVLIIVPFFLRHRLPAVTAAWFFFLLSIFPVLGFVQSGPEFMAARFTYFPSIGLASLAGIVVTAIVGKRSAEHLPVIVTVFGCCCLLLVLAVLTRRDISHWKDDLSLWNRVIQLNPTASGRAYYERGYAHFLAGNYRQALDDTERALQIAIAKGYNRQYEIYLQRARIQRRMWLYDDAALSYGRALELYNGPETWMYRTELDDLCREMGKGGGECGGLQKR